jgi:hypothetical protein
VTDNGERRKDHVLRQRVDKLIGRVHAAREEIVEKGLEAVHDDPDRRERGEDDSKRPSDAGPADAPA